MEPTPVNENQIHQNCDNNDAALFKGFQTEDNCTLTSGQVYDHGNFSQTLENYDLLSAKESRDETATFPSEIVNSKHNNDVDAQSRLTSDKDSISSGKSNIDNSVASTYSNSLNSKINDLAHYPSGSRKLEDEIASPSTSECFKRRKVDIFGSDVGPKIYNIKGNLVTPPIIAKNLSEAFNSLPIHGKPEPGEDIEDFYSNKIREFVGFDLNDDQFASLAKFCSPEHLKTGKELIMKSSVPTLTVLSVFDQKEYDEDTSNLCVVKKHRLRCANDCHNNYQKKLKYRGIRLMPLVQAEVEGAEPPAADLEPGRDNVYHVRLYRPFPYNIKEKLVSSRHSVFSRDVVAPGRLRLSALRERMVCANDVSMRLDVSPAPDDLPNTAAKELFPSGFLFINNVFYVDSRPGCHDITVPLRAWAAQRGLGDFPVRDLHDTRIDDLTIRLGHPEVYIHQGNCEHIFTFSEIRLLNPDDPLSTTQYPAHTAVSQNQSVYCTTCAEFGAKWVVTGCQTVPFDPAYFCDTCFKMYLYKDGKKIGDFKAYSYRGNEMNILKTSG